MEETVKQEVVETTEEKTFTQAELNAIVTDRLKRAEAKYSDYEDLKTKASKFDELEEKNKSELEKATEKAASLEAELNAMKKANEIRDIRTKVSLETGVPLNLLTADTEDGCKEQAESIKAFATPQSYPQVRDGGEVLNIKKRSARDDFSAWAEQANN